MQTKCCVPGCQKNGAYEVLLYDVYPREMHVFFERDFTCPFLCAKHMAENEAQADGTREPRGIVLYPYTNRDRAQGFTVYRPLELRAFLHTLVPADVYLLRTLAALGGGTWRNPPDVLDLYLRESRSCTPAQAIAALMDNEDLGKHLGLAMEDLARRGFNGDQRLNRGA